MGLILKPENWVGSVARERDGEEDHELSPGSWSWSWGSPGGACERLSRCGQQGRREPGQNLESMVSRSPEESVRDSETEGLCSDRAKCTCLGRPRGGDPDPALLCPPLIGDTSVESS